jgi:hypothetical protein
MIFRRIGHPLRPTITPTAGSKHTTPRLPRGGVDGDLTVRTFRLAVSRSVPEFPARRENRREFFRFGRLLAIPGRHSRSGFIVLRTTSLSARRREVSRPGQGIFSPRRDFIHRQKLGRGSVASAKSPTRTTPNFIAYLLYWLPPTPIPHRSPDSGETCWFVRLIPASRPFFHPARVMLWANKGLMHRSKSRAFSITSSARASSIGGTSMPSALAVFKLITSSYFVGACMEAICPVVSKSLFSRVIAPPEHLSLGAIGRACRADGFNFGRHTLA